MRISARLQIMLWLLAFWVITEQGAQAQVVTSGGATIPTLKQQLSTGLLARTPQEQAFVEQVVSLVQQGKLPKSLVNSTFDWARYKRPYPMPYFERALRLRAKKAGIEL